MTYTDAETFQPSQIKTINFRPGLLHLLWLAGDIKGPTNLSQIVRKISLSVVV